VLVAMNPAAAVSAEVRGGFVWRMQTGVMYQVTRIGQDVPAGPARWAPAAATLTAIAAVVATAQAIRAGWRRFRWGV
jgi:hypothetical protein